MVMVNIEFGSEEEFEQIKQKAKKLGKKSEKVIANLKQLFFL